MHQETNNFNAAEGTGFTWPNAIQRNHVEMILGSILSYHQGDSLYTKEHLEIKGFTSKINIKIKTKLESVQNDTSGKQHFTGDFLKPIIHKRIRGTDNYKENKCHDFLSSTVRYNPVLKLKK